MTNRAIAIGLLLLILVVALSQGISVVCCSGSIPIVESDRENEKAPDGLYTLHGPITITKNQDFIDQVWPGNGILGDPYVIEGLNITSDIDVIGVHVANTTAFFEIKNCIMSSPSTEEGILLENVTHGVVQGCIIDAHFGGIHLHRSPNCTLANNIIYSGHGFRVMYSEGCKLINNNAYNTIGGYEIAASYNCTIVHNTCYNSQENGFSIVTSIGTIIVNNTASNNYGRGFHLASLGWCSVTNNTATRNSYGFYIIDTLRCNLTNNTAASNSGDGFYAVEGYATQTNNTLTHNTAFGNSRYGINLDTGSVNSTLFLNRLGNNGVSNAQDNGGSNKWDDGNSSGNYWTDYIGEGVYIIPGSAGSVDNYPFFWDYVEPTVPTTTSTTIPTTTTPHTTTANINDTFMYAVLLSIGISIVVLAILAFAKKR